MRPRVKRSSVYPSLWALNQACRQGLLRRGPLGGRPCPVTTGRDGQIIMETSWGQEIGFPFQSGRWWEFVGSHHNRLTAIDWSLACLIKDSFNCPCCRKQMPALFAFRGKKKKKLHYERLLSYFSNTWHQLGLSERGSHGTRCNSALYPRDGGWIAFWCILSSYKDDSLLISGVKSVELASS